MYNGFSLKVSGRLRDGGCLPGILQHYHAVSMVFLSLFANLQCFVLVLVLLLEHFNSLHSSSLSSGTFKSCNCSSSSITQI